MTNPGLLNDDEGERLDAELRSARRAEVLMARCVHCYAVPEILARDEYGRPKVLGWPLVRGCPDHDPDWVAAEGTECPDFPPDS